MIKLVLKDKISSNLLPLLPTTLLLLISIGFQVGISDDLVIGLLWALEDRAAIFFHPGQVKSEKL